MILIMFVDKDRKLRNQVNHPSYIPSIIRSTITKMINSIVAPKHISFTVTINDDDSLRRKKLKKNNAYDIVCREIGNAIRMLSFGIIIYKDKEIDVQKFIETCNFLKTVKMRIFAALKDSIEAIINTNHNNHNYTVFIYRVKSSHPNTNSRFNESFNTIHHLLLNHYGEFNIQEQPTHPQSDTDDMSSAQKNYASYLSNLPNTETPITVLMVFNLLSDIVIQIHDSLDNTYTFMTFINDMSIEHAHKITSHDTNKNYYMLMYVNTLAHLYPLVSSIFTNERDKTVSTYLDNAQFIELYNMLTYYDYDDYHSNTFTKNGIHMLMSIILSYYHRYICNHLNDTIKYDDINACTHLRISSIPSFYNSNRDIAPIKIKLIDNSLYNSITIENLIPKHLYIAYILHKINLYALADIVYDVSSQQYMTSQLEIPIDTTITIKSKNGIKIDIIGKHIDNIIANSDKISYALIEYNNILQYINNHSNELILTIGEVFERAKYKQMKLMQLIDITINETIQAEQYMKHDISIEELIVRINYYFNDKNVNLTYQLLSN